MDEREYDEYGDDDQPEIDDATRQENLVFTLRSVVREEVSAVAARYFWFAVAVAAIYYFFSR